MSICLTWFPISGLGKPNIYQNLVWITMYGILLGGCLTVKNYWELLTGDDGLVLQELGIDPFLS